MFDVTTIALERSLDMRARQHDVHASNIANANVPNYKAKKIDFEHKFDEVMQKLEAAENAKEALIGREKNVTPEIQKIEGDVYEDPFAQMNGTGNTVNMEKEQTEMAKNTIAYETALKMISKKFALEKAVLEGGR